jgi:small subunit ribosomal protein S16
VGVYDPRPDPSSIRIDNDKAVDWLRKGAQPTGSVRKLLEISGAWGTFRGDAPSEPAAEPASKPTKATAAKAAATASKSTATKSTAKKATAKKAAATKSAPEADDGESEAEAPADEAADENAEEGG